VDAHALDTALYHLEDDIADANDGAILNDAYRDHIMQEPPEPDIEEHVAAELFVGPVEFLEPGQELELP
jgi:hypothetical protein